MIRFTVNNTYTKQPVVRCSKTGRGAFLLSFIVLILVIYCPAHAQSKVVYSNDFGSSSKVPTNATTPFAYGSPHYFFTKYVFVTGPGSASSQTPSANHYSITNVSGTSTANQGYPAWWLNTASWTDVNGKIQTGVGQLYDHTTGGVNGMAPPNPAATGYGNFVIINANGDASMPLFVDTINNLCPGTDLIFSIWAISMIGTNASSATNYVTAYLTFVVRDLAGDTLATIVAGNITNKTHTWVQYGSHFTIPPKNKSVSSVVLSIYDSQKGTTGNDIGIDDINIIASSPSIIPPNAAVCVGEDTLLDGNTSEAGAIIHFTTHQWYKDGVPIPGATDSVLILKNIQLSDSGYYDLMVTTCIGDTLYSDSSHIVVHPLPVLTMTNDTVCSGAPVSFNYIASGFTSYAWRGPNGFSSTDQNPRFASADTTMTGWYRLTAIPTFCGDMNGIKDSLYLCVHPPLSAFQQTDSLIICVGDPVTLSSAVRGGSGVYTYQWQSSPDGASGWTDIEGATNSTCYLPITKTQTAGTYYFRKVTNDVCGSINGGVIKLVVSHCYIPVNPHLMNKVNAVQL